MRLTSLDVFRGITIAFMIVINQASLGSEVYGWLEHADWHGCTLADVIFPFFLFIVGVAIAFSFRPYLAGEKPVTPTIYRKVFQRSAVLFGLGLLLNGFPVYDFGSLRIMGVLQRIALTYLIAALLVLKLPKKALWIVAIGLLLGYWVALTGIPVPGYGAGVLTREGNFGAYIDRLLIPASHLYQGDGYRGLGDPEGLFSTLPAVVTVLIGYFAGDWIRRQPIQSRTSWGLALFGIGCLIAGIIWDQGFPINKKLWTSSFVLYSGGWALLLLSACYEWLEVRQQRRWGRPFEVLGLNAIFAFVASVLLIKVMVRTTVGSGENAPSLYNWLSQQLFLSWTTPENASFLFAVGILGFWWLILYGFHRRGWWLKI